MQVTCPDRHGLLADVVRALRELPLEITTAAVTTRRDGVVHDVFQVRGQGRAGRCAQGCLPAGPGPFLACQQQRVHRNVPPRSCFLPPALAAELLWDML